MWRKVSALNDRHMLLAWVSLVFVALTDLYVRLVATGVISDPRFFLGHGRARDPRVRRRRHRGRRGRPAGRHRGPDRGARTALICKSLLGKAHTVMAEGGIAAAMGNVYPDDNWQVHFRDTMRGGKMLNNWRMAQLHAQEAPDRVYELEDWGALFDRTEDGRILQRDFGGHRYARLAHVGDRTGLEMIRTLQHHAVHSGIDVFMECTVIRLLNDDGRIAGAVAYWRESGRLIVFKAKAVVLATGGIGKAWKVTSNSWEYTGDGHALALWAGADLIDMEFVQFHPTGMVWPPASAASWSPRGCAATAACCATPRASGSCSTTSPRSSGPRRPRPRRRPTAGTTTAGTTAAPPTCCPATRWPGPSTPR